MWRDGRRGDGSIARSAATMVVAAALAWAMWPMGHVTAAGGITLAVNQVDDSAFPDVTAYVTLSDPAGAPITDVPASAFSAAEDRQPITGLDVRPVVNEGRSIALILALDVSGSMEGAPLAATQAAARSLIEGLGLQDRVALLTFSEQVTWAQEFTSERAVLLQALENLKASGNTAFNDALHEAARRMSALPAGRRAIVLLTDGEDTTSVTGFAQALNMAQASNTPVYTVGFGPKVKPDLLQRTAQLTGGRYFDAPAAAELQSSFQDILNQLKQQHVLSYRSQILPDMREHELLVRVTYAQDVLEDSRRFVARAITPTVTLPGLADGAQVRGSVNLAPAIVSSSPISQVIYLLSGQPLATLNTAPFAFAWDTATVAPGPYRLALQAVDSDGRSGTWEGTVTVAPPLAIRFRSPTDGARVGGLVTLAVDAQAAYDLAQVTYRLDDLSLETITAPPFQMPWRTASAAAGPHRLAAEARDVMGNVAEAAIQVILAPPVVAQIRTPAQGEIVPETLVVAADVQAMSGLARVEFWVDGEQQTVREAGPYEFAWDSRQVAPGEHTLLVRAVDLLGDQGEDQVEVKVPLVQQPLRPPWSWVLVLGALALAALIALAARWRVRRHKRRFGQGDDFVPNRPLPEGVPALTWLREDGTPAQFVLVQGDNAIGRAASENQVVIAAPTVSRQHALIVLRGSQATLHNLSERSHSAVNGDLVEAARTLRPGDRIELGDEKLIFSIGEESYE